MKDTEIDLIMKLTDITIDLEGNLKYAGTSGYAYLEDMFMFGYA